MSPGDGNSLIGIWKLKSLQFELADTGEIADAFGPNPSGYLILTGEGRMMTIVTRSDRAPPKEDADGSVLFNTMMAYTGISGSRAMTSSSRTSISLGIPPGTASSRPGFSSSTATLF